MNQHVMIGCVIGAMAMPLAALAQQQQALQPLPYRDFLTVANTMDYDAHIVTADEFLELRTAGALVLDLRSAQNFAANHIEGAVHLGADAITAERLAELMPDPTRPVLIYCTNSLTLSRMISLTDIALPQFVALGYDGVRAVGLAGLQEAASDGRLPLVSD